MWEKAPRGAFALEHGRHVITFYRSLCRLDAPKSIFVLSRQALGFGGVTRIRYVWAADRGIPRRLIATLRALSGLTGQVVTWWLAGRG